MQNSINRFNSFVEQYYTFTEENGYIIKSNLSGSFYTALEESYLLPVDILSYAKLVSSLLNKTANTRQIPAFGVDEEEDGSSFERGRRPQQEYAAGRGWFDRTATLDNQVKKGDSKLTALQKNIQHLMSDLNANEFEKREVEKIVTISDDRIQHLKPLGVYIGSKFIGIFSDPVYADDDGEEKSDDYGEEKSDDGMSIEAQFREAERARVLAERAQEQSERMRIREDERESKDESESTTQWSTDELRKRAEAVGWIIRFSRTHQRIYYFNTRTGESTFEEPDI